MDHIKESAKKKWKRRVRYFCKICHKFNHNTQDSGRIQTINQKLHRAVLMLEMVEMVKYEWPELCGDVGVVERSGRNGMNCER